ncbi:hypothetical protein [Zhongshania sp.]|jgi:ABC-type Fe3+-siderophore transport system permease subunit|uniref:hypothetical protein n=1 Tax=Zhongshania sp. TaxID=1971902 RepID=UPI0039E4A7B5
MNDILQIIGSVASILGVPLAVYLYLKSQVQKYATVRREIVKRLSHQIGEGRTVGLFELNAVIDSLVRENRLRLGAITGNSVIEDLIAETVSSPLLDSGRKEQLITELSEVHSMGKVFHAIQSDNSIFEKFLQHLKVESGSVDETEKIREVIKNTTNKSSETSKTPELFGAIASIIALVTATLSVAGITEGPNILPKILDSNLITSISLGVAGSVLAAVLVAVISKINTDKKA